MKLMFLLSVMTAAFLSGVITAQWPYLQQRALLQQDGIQLFRQPLPVSPADFVNQQGEPVSLASFRGRNLLVFFGYTYCPDICPMTLLDLNRLWRQLPEDVREQWQVVMVSVDPERDTPESLAPYLAYFNPSFQALTGNVGALRQLAAELNAIYSKVERGEDQAYLMDHSANLVIIDRDGAYRGYIAPPHDTARMLPLLQAVHRALP